MTEKELYEKLGEFAEQLNYDDRAQFAHLLRAVTQRALRRGDANTLVRWLRDTGHDRVVGTP